MNHLEAMRIFQRVAELASFTQAADSLGLPKASVSAAVRQLEASLGTRLLQRTTRKVHVTQDGEQFYARSKLLLADVDDVQTMFQSAAALEGRIRADMPSGLAAQYVVPRLAEFLAAHPRIEVELSSTDRRVDLVREGFDCVVRVGGIGDSSLIARPLGHFQVLNCVSADYAAQHGVPQTLDDLPLHSLVHYAQNLGSTAPGFEYVGADDVEHTVPMQSALTVNNASAYTAACIAGLGLIQTPEPAARQLLRAGQFVEVLSQHRCAPMPVTLLYVNRQYLPRRVRAFMDWLALVIKDAM